MVRGRRPQQQLHYRPVLLEITNFGITVMGCFLVLQSTRGSSSPKEIKKSFLEVHLRIHFMLLSNNL